MALNQKIPSEHILDLKGQLLHSDAAALLRALDKLLTLGAYYSSGHAQYLQAAEEAAAAIRGAIGSRRSLSLEITAEGLMVLGQQVDPHQRQVRQVHDLLVPLNIARLEISAFLTTDHLRQALEVLQQHRVRLGSASSFQEIVIEGLPATVRTVSRSVLQGEATSALSDENWLPPLTDGPEGDSERLAREFMELVTEILDNLEQSEAQAGPVGGAAGNLELSRQKIAELRAALRRLIEVRPSPRELLQLIAHARSALELSHDPRRTDLVFQILRKELVEDFADKERRTRASAREIHYRLEIDQLAEAVAQLDIRAGVMEPPEKGALESHLAICLYLLAGDPVDSLRQSSVSGLAELFSRPDFRAENLEPCLTAIAEALDSGYPDWVDALVSALSSALRQGRPKLIGAFWQGVREAARHEDLLVLWPHLVNDILLGLGRIDPEVGRNLLLWAGKISPEGALAQLDRLEKLPALAGDKAVADLFKIPLALLYPVHVTLARTRLAGWLSRGLYVSMRARPATPLIRALMGALEYQPDFLDFYLELVAQSRGGEPSPRLKAKAGALLMGILQDLPREKREEPWVPVALDGLAQLGVDEARPLFRAILDSRRLVFLKSWPPECRKVAAWALTGEEV